MQLLRFDLNFYWGRKAYCAGARQKPAVVVDKDFKLWIGNETEDELELSGCELCGFNLGTFEEKAVAGTWSKKLGA